ncbi:MAG: DNA replication/repair protein RecF [Bacilli bacterium]|nr:DNA replication/repair protein RecF [Bacilli bacterium]
MKIEHIKLLNFRNYDQLELDFNPRINIFIGNNGQGKTNILESVYVLSLSKSNRSGQDADLIEFNKEYLTISGKVENDGLKKNLEVYIDNYKKKVSINGKEIHRIKDYISNFCVISFVPTDLDIIKGSPSVRRNLLNVDISQLFNNYISVLNEYNKIIKIRNEYLKKLYINNNSDFRYLDIINDKLIESADKIYEYRFRYLKEINSYIPSIYKKITGLDGLVIKYENTLGIEEYDREEIRKVFLKKFKKNLNQEMIQGMTLTGPHRDDFSFYLNDVDMKLFASQGQQRMAIIAFKISELNFYKKILGSYPVLLLDDIFSEIDSSKRNKIVKFLKKDIQTIITTTDINDISEDLIKEAVIYKISNNKITKKGKKQ